MKSSDIKIKSALQFCQIFNNRFSISDRISFNMSKYQTYQIRQYCGSDNIKKNMAYHEKFTTSRQRVKKV